MRGHEPVIAMRLRGVRPKAVAMSVHALRPDVWRNWPEFSSWAEVEIEPQDAISRLDLRYVIGLPVMLDGRDEDRLQEAAAAIKAAGASPVYVTHHGPRASTTEIA